MSATFDVLDILDLDDPNPKKTILDKDALLARTEKKKSRGSAAPKRPDHVPREVWGLQSTLNTNLPPLMPTDDTPVYKQPKAMIGVRRVRRWYWAPFTNSARQDGLVLYHWRREKPDSDTDNDYYFARYNKHVPVPNYSSEEYETFLKDPRWTEERTTHLMELARRFDLRFIHMHDRWDSEHFPGRPSVEDLKERYYGILAQLDKIRGTNLSQGMRYDASHERRRKQQLSLLYGRTEEQVEEEERLVVELRKIEARRRERERKKQDLQKLISLADSVTRDSEINDQNALSVGSGLDDVHDGLTLSSTQLPLSNLASNQRKRIGMVGSGDSSLSLSNPNGQFANVNDLNSSLSSALSGASNVLNSNYIICFVDPSRNPGVHLRSQKMKLPSNLGQKKIRIIENFLGHLQIDPSPPATADIVEAYNNLRSKVLLLYELRMATLQCDYELQSARLRLETFAPNQALPRSLENLPVLSATEEPEVTSQSVDPSILSALRMADSKRPILPRHSLGVAGTLAAAAGSLGICGSDKPDQRHEKSLVLNDSSSGVTFALTSNEPQNPPTTRQSSFSRSFAIPSPSTTISVNDVPSTDGGNLQRRRRAAALEQGRVLKKLKIRGQLVD